MSAKSGRLREFHGRVGPQTSDSSYARRHPGSRRKVWTLAKRESGSGVPQLPDAFVPETCGRYERPGDLACG